MKLVELRHKYCKIKLFSGAILHEPEGVFRTQPNAYEGAFLQNSEQLQAVNYYHKKAVADLQLGSKYCFVNITLHLTFFLEKQNL